MKCVVANVAVITNWCLVSVVTPLELNCIAISLRKRANYFKKYY
jgi:hypothetical protein